MIRTRILVVEDESLVARDIKNMLLNLGCEVLAVVSTGEEAIERVEKEMPDIVLMDIVLKGEVDGIKAAEAIRERFYIPVIYVTAYADETTLQRAKVTEPFGYILKPFEEKELKTTIEMALFKSKMDSRLREREQFLTTILKNIGDSVIATDNEGLIQFMNPLAETLTGWMLEEALGKPLKDIFRLAKSNLRKQFRLYEEENGLKSSHELPGESVLITKSGKKVPVEENRMPLFNGKKGVTGNVLVFRDITERKRAEKEQQQSFKKLRKALEGTIQAIALTLEMRDPYTAGHQHRVSQLSCAIARDLGLSKDRIEGLRMAADIHDIGKIYVPAEILSKPGKITDIEYSIIKTHPQVGYDILKTILFPWPIATIVLQHHERLDGSGYPAGIDEEKILLEARILMVADVVEAMSSHRPYRPSRGVNKALEEILKHRGTLYDQAVVDSCIRLFQKKGFSFD